MQDQGPTFTGSESAELVEGFLDKLRAPESEARPGTGTTKSKPWLTWGLLAGLTLGLVLGVGAGVLSTWLPESHKLTRSVARERPDPKLVPTGTNRQAIKGLLQFRGNPSRTYYGEGPVPERPQVLWRYPKEPMCAESRVGSKVSTWCGTGWTGQPVIWERPDGITEVIVGAYDRKVHFINAATGRRTRPPFVTGDIIKGSVSLDPNGDPLLYFGSRDNRLRVVALDRPRPTQLWALSASFVPGIWNNDWDGNPTVIDDVLYAGGENGYFFAVRLNRDYDQRGLVRIDPEMLVAIRGWTDSLLDQVGDQNASIENSVSIYEDRAYFANSAGRVVGLDISRVSEGRTPIVFDFWVGDDVDASIVIDQQGMLYVAVELERYLPRADELGQLIKLDPKKPDDPVVWSLKIPPSFADYKGGIWATPALADGMLYVATHAGQLLAVDAETGQITFTDDLGPHAWSSPVVIDSKLLVANCRGELRNYSITDPAQPQLEWLARIPSHACIESTPAVWKGKIVVGARDGYIYALGDPSAPTPSNGLAQGPVSSD